LQYLPRCVLGSVVFTIAIGLIDVRGLRDIGRESPGELRLALVTAVVVVAIGVEQGILLAMTLSLLRHVRHSYRPHTAVLVEEPTGIWRHTPAVPGTTSRPGLIVYHFGADLFYANVARFETEVHGLLSHAPIPVRLLLVDAGAITSVDFSAARSLRTFLEELLHRKVTLALVHVDTYLRADLDRHHLIEVIGTDMIFDKLHDALASPRLAQLDRAKAEACSADPASN